MAVSVSQHSAEERVTGKESDILHRGKEVQYAVYLSVPTARGFFPGCYDSMSAGQLWSIYCVDIVCEYSVILLNLLSEEIKAHLNVELKNRSLIFGKECG